MIGAFIAYSASGRKDAPGYVIDGDGCHVWVGSRTRGYGMVHVDGRMRYVHRVRYEREIGPIPEGMTLDHFACNNGAGGCCNPLHCRPVQPRENALRGDTVAAANAAKTHCPRGHPFRAENLSRSALRAGIRKCQICQMEAQRVCRAKKPRTDAVRAAEAAYARVLRARRKARTPFFRDGHSRA